MKKFLKRKSSIKLTISMLEDPASSIYPASLSLEVLPQVDIPPCNRNLSFSPPTVVTIAPTPPTLRICSQFPTEVVPGLIDEDEDTISTYIDGVLRETVFICTICYCDLFRSTQFIKKHLQEVQAVITKPRMKHYFDPRFECIR